MKRAEGRSPAPLLLLGTVRGSESEGGRVASALDDYRPDLLLLGLSPEEVHALEEHFSDPHVEPWVPLAPTEMSYARGLASYGPTRVPSPAFLSALAWARANGATVRGVEPPDEDYSALFLEHVGYLDLVRRTIAERGLKGARPSQEDAEGYAIAWEARSTPGGGSRRLSEARARHVAEEVRRTSGRSPDRGSAADASLKNRVALVVDVERFAPLLHELSSAPRSDLREVRAGSRPPHSPPGSGPEGPRP